MCPHTPPCPAPSAPDREAAHTIVSHPEQGWSLLCNGVVIFEDTGELLPGGAFIAPHRPTDLAAFDRPVGVPPGHGGQAPAALSVIGDISRSHPTCWSDDSSLNPCSRPQPGARSPTAGADQGCTPRSAGLFLGQCAVSYRAHSWARRSSAQNRGSAPWREAVLGRTHVHPGRAQLAVRQGDQASRDRPLACRR